MDKEILPRQQVPAKTTKAQALQIAREYLRSKGLGEVGDALSETNVTDSPWSAAGQYIVSCIKSPVWCVHYSVPPIIIKSGNLLLISQETGEVLSDGDAHDEG